MKINKIKLVTENKYLLVKGKKKLKYKLGKPIILNKLMNKKEQKALKDAFDKEVLQLLNDIHFGRVMLFKLNEKELKQMNKFKKAHLKCTQVGAIGGKFTFSFTSTGLGDIIKIKCNVCDKEEDVTDIDTW